MQYNYDQGTYGAGRLTGVSDSQSTLTWSHDAPGRVTQHTQTVDTVTLDVACGFDAHGRLSTLTTPSGQVIGYSYGNGRVTGLTVNGGTLIGQVTYRPLGPITGWQWGNGSTTARTYDTNGRLTGISRNTHTSLHVLYPGGADQSETTVHVSLASSDVKEMASGRIRLLMEALWKGSVCLASIGCGTRQMEQTCAKINRLLNRTLRSVNELAVVVASSPLAKQSDVVDQLTSVLAGLSKVQKLVISEDPDLEYHYDPLREPTSFMKKIRSLVEEADRLERIGQHKKALAVLIEARDTEPPPFTHEELSRRIRSLETK